MGPAEMLWALRRRSGAGWQWAGVSGLDSFAAASDLAGCTAIGWDLADDVGDSVLEAVAAGNPALVAAPAETLNAIEVALESPFTADSGRISSFRENGADPGLVARVEEAAACWTFRADGRVMEPTVEFIWALASAVGVLVDGVLEDEEDATLLDCTDDGGD